MELAAVLFAFNRTSGAILGTLEVVNEVLGPDGRPLSLEHPNWVLGSAEFLMAWQAPVLRDGFSRAVPKSTLKPWLSLSSQINWAARGLRTPDLTLGTVATRFHVTPNATGSAAEETDTLVALAATPDEMNGSPFLLEALRRSDLGG
jgi:hypothetical protein